MNNIHILPTDKPSRLHNKNGELGNYPSTKLYIEDFKGNQHNSFHIYITSDEEIKEGEWMYNELSIGSISKATRKNIDGIKRDKEKGYTNHLYKIILTTDQDLIKDGVQPINDEFLEWFVKNPSCEEVKVADYGNVFFDDKVFHMYKIIIPQEEPKALTKLEIAKNIAAIGIGKEEPKQETLEEAAENMWLDPIKNLTSKMSFIAGAKWQAAQDKNKYNEEDMISFATFYDTHQGAEYWGKDLFKVWYNIKKEIIMNKETIEEAAESRYGTDMDSIRGSNVYDLNTDLKRGFIEGAKWMQERMYSEEDMKQFAWECVANFLSNNDNKVEMALTEVIIDRNNKQFEQFKKK